MDCLVRHMWLAMSFDSIRTAFVGLVFFLSSSLFLSFAVFLSLLAHISKDSVEADIAQDKAVMTMTQETGLSTHEHI